MNCCKSKLVVGLLVSILFSCQTEKPQKSTKKSVKHHVIEYEYGFSLKEFNVVHDTVQQGWTLSQMMTKYGINMENIFCADELSRDSTVGMKYIVAGKPFALFTHKNDTSNRVQLLVYQSSILDYVIFDFRDSVAVKKVTRPISTKSKTLTGNIVQNSNLTSTINKKTKNINITGELAESIAGIFAWSIDFFKLQPNDKFKVLYDEKFVEGKPYGIGRIQAIWFKHEGQPYYAFYFQDSTGEISGYYDEKGKEMKRMFLMAPVQFSRISSGFSMNRFHPVQKRFKSHLGTDYAAPSGTPIFSTADGTVIAATRSQFNGNYVKVKHNATYTTQYLHMSRIADGMHPGVHVKQGQVIGYVGMTGLATGPHVCYRFWKNGKQVNHRSEKFPTSIPLKAEILPLFLKTIQPLKEKLDKIVVR
jgi:murein DD-endopeptidase MepM/ murein hydrolase activator NlpD